MESEAGMNPRLDEFAHRVKVKMEEVDTASGKKALELQTELSAYIAEQTQILMNQGIPVMEIQNALRAAVDRVEQTHAPDADESDDELSERLEPPLYTFTFFLPIEETSIAAFSTGDFDVPAMIERIRISPDIIQLEMSRGLELILGDFGKNQDLSEVIAGGEIVAGSDGEAFIPEELIVKEEDGSQYYVSDPAVFKTAREVQSINALLESVDQKMFFKKADIKKLVKSGWLEGYDPRSVKKEAAYIIGELWKEFILLKEVYRGASDQRKGMFIFVGYQGNELDDDV
jgi:hypothetical protein